MLLLAIFFNLFFQPAFKLENTDIFDHQIQFTMVLWFNHSLKVSCISTLSPEKSNFFQIVPTMASLFESFQTYLFVWQSRDCYSFINTSSFFILQSYSTCKTHSKQSKSSLILIPWSSNKNIFSTDFVSSLLPAFIQAILLFDLTVKPPFLKQNYVSLKSQKNSHFHYSIGRIN